MTAQDGSVSGVSMAKRTVAIDFNGVLDTYAGWVKGGDGTEYPPRPGAKEFLERLNAMGYRPVIYSTISPHAIMEWLRKYGMWDLVHDVSQSKPMAIAYVDDRAIRFDGDYSSVLEQLDGFEPFWKVTTDG